jgi:hypothetical protein
VIDKDKYLEDFFAVILNKNDSTIRDFLADYPTKIVIEYLLDEIQNTDDPWKLGRVFGNLAKREHRYAPIDPLIHSHYKALNVEEKVNTLDFLSGYWDSVGAKLVFVIEIGEEIVSSISSNKKSEWDKNSILLSIPLIALSYLNNKNNPEYEDELRSISEIIKFLKAYTLRTAPQSSSHILLQKC